MHNYKTLLKCAHNFFFFSLCLIAIPVMAQEVVFLKEGESTSFTAYFSKGEDIYASCDEDCFDVDLYLYSPSGRLVDSDTLDDDFPIVTAPKAGDYRVEVIMYDCDYALGCAADIDSDEGFVSY